MCRYLVVLAVLLLWAGNAFALFGSGVEADPWLIQSLADFDVFADPANSATYWASGVYTRLDCDPNLAGRTYTTAVIAPDTGTPFAGVFDGNNHIISNLMIDGGSYLGLFGRIEGSVEELGLENVDITGRDGPIHLGGLCGMNAGGTITNCYASGSVTGGDNSNGLGGLCGANDDGGTITNCYAAGSVTGGVDSTALGGLCGWNYYFGTTITNCYATGSVTGGDNSFALGGLCGWNRWSAITNCYATGLVTGGGGSFFLGGLCGANNATITNCYFYLVHGPDNHLGTALDALQMQDESSFAGFDFAGNSNDGMDDYWTIINGHCPKLTWQDDDGPLPPSPPVTTLLGSGYSDDPFQINSYADFMEFRTNTGLRCGYYIVTTDIDLSGDTFSTAVIDGVFGGHFDGNGHVISNITIDTAGAGTHYLCFFSLIISGSVSNLGIENINITGGEGSDYLGSLCGRNAGGTITNCYATGSVTGGYTSDFLGGLCGENAQGTISNCYATGSVTGGANSEGLGGLCGRNWYGTITNCYAAGSVTGGVYSESLGGLCGMNYGTITNSFWDTQTSGMDVGYNLGTSPGTITNVVGKTTLQMQTEATFTVGGWDFDPDDGDAADWMMLREAEDYPRLVWQEIFAGDIAGLYGVNAVDFAEIALHWGQGGCPAGCEDADINGDGSVGFGDLLYIVGDWGEGNWSH